MTYKINEDLEACKEDRLLILCARTSINDEIRSEIRSIAMQNLDWDYLIERSSKHRLIQLFYSQLDSVCPDLVPGNVMEHLKSVFHENVRINLLFLGELLRLLELFKSYNIIAVPYKGPVLAIQAYDNLALREFNDLDIFIQKKDFFKVKKLLISEGYISEFQLSNSKEVKYVESQREKRFFNRNLKLTLDIQWKVSALFFSLPKPIVLKDEIVFMELNNSEIAAFSTEDLLLILCLHNAGHRWTNLAWLCDIAELINNKLVNWTKVVKKAEKLYIKRILFINIYLISDLFGLEVPKEILKYLKSDSNIRIISNKIEQKVFIEENDKNLLDEIYFNLKLRDNIYYGIKDAIRDAVLPTPSEWKRLNSSHIFYPLYYIYRPLSILVRYKFK